MSLDAFIDDVGARAGLAERAAIETGTRATLRALGAALGGLPPALHDAIPAALRDELRAGDGQPVLAPEALYDRIARETGLRVGQALELTQSAVAELGGRLAEPARDQLRRLLPEAWAALVLDPRPAGLTPGAGATAGGDGGGGRTLATGRPGSGRPLADSAPAQGQAHSVAATDDPHDDRRLSAARPGSQDDGHTLAKGRPGSDHPVSDSD
ncbi:MAG: DUF2267 domain-containing protein [Myxococcales bacterium]|nr:DUF2267 domain-containing protein [Myxococcales bacterium]